MCRCGSGSSWLLAIQARVSGEMLLAVLLSNAIFAALFVSLCVIGRAEATPCDTKWIRLVYMLSCGKKKRESISVRNESYSESLPTDIFGAIEYFRERDPFNPLLNDQHFLNKILEDDENELHPERDKYMKHKQGRNWHSKKAVDETLAKESLLMKKIFHSTVYQNHLGIPGFPDQWDVHELLEQKINENHRREIDRLLEECCKTASESTCNGDTFRGACK